MRDDTAQTALLMGSISRLENVIAAQPDSAGDPLTAALRAAAKAVGRDLPGTLSAKAGGRPAERLSRLAREAGLLSRAIDVGGGFRDAGPGPLIAFAKNDDRVHVLTRHGAGWRIVEPAEGRGPRRLDAACAGALGRVAYQISPALPDGAITMARLMAFGLYQVRADLLGFAAASLLAGLLGAILPIATGFVIDTILPGHETALMAEVAVALAVVIAANLMVRLASAVAQARIHGEIGSNLRAAAIDRTLTILASRPIASAPTLNLTVRAVESWNRAAWGFWLQIASSVLTLAPSLAFLMLQAPGMGLLVATLLGAAAASAAAIGGLRSAALRKNAAANVNWMSVAYESLTQIDTVRSLAAERRMFRRWVDGFGRQQARQIDANRIATYACALGASLEATILAAVVAVALMTADLAHPAASAPLLMAAMTVAGAGAGLVGVFGNLSQLAILRGLMAPILAATSDQPAQRGDPAPVLTGRIKLSGVSYRPGAGQDYTLRNVSLEIEAGAHVGIVGPSGSGKTTLIDVMIGLRKPEVGLIAFDGHDLRELDDSSLRRQIGIVGQNVRLFPGSLRANVSLEEEISDDEIWRALHLAGLDEEVRQMPLGLSTPVGDATPTLSGGQVQRVLFARAMAGKPRIVILDEATSALDAAAQKTLVASLKRQKITVIAIAHRLDTLAHCDRIHVIDRGQIVEQGTPTELARAGGLFSRLMGAEMAA